MTDEPPNQEPTGEQHVGLSAGGRWHLPLIVRVILQIIAGASCFLVFLVVSSAIDYVVDFVDVHHLVTHLIITCLRGVNLVLLASDIICFIVFVVVEAVVLIRALLGRLKE